MTNQASKSSSSEVTTPPPVAPSAPVDRFRVVYLILLIHGIGSLLPWNMFITANDYFVWKLTPVNSSAAVVNETAGNTAADDSLNFYRNNFLSFVGIASKLPNTGFQLLNLLLPAAVVRHQTRILMAIAGQTLLFAVTTGFAVADTSKIISLFYGLTMVIVVVVNVFNGVFQSSFYGQAAQLPSQYMNAVVTGMNISGVVSSLFMIVSTASTPDLRTGAVVYFTIAVLFLIVSFLTYVYMMRNEFFNHFVTSDDQKKPADEESDARRGTANRPPYLLILRHIWVHLYSIFFTYFVTLALFPAVLVGIVSTTSLSGPYFSVVWCFLCFNLSAMLGNMAVDYWPHLIPERRLWLAVTARLVFVPIFLFCNYRPESRSLPVLLHNDAFYIVAVLLFGLTSGYTSSLALVLVPQSVSPTTASTAGMMASLTLMVGIAAGISSSFFFANLV